ncbi:hypothetical protein GCM10010872_05410 [Dyella flava]|nr:hypothetical protein GCM10010872_05410 [Dyella flava]
MILSNGGAWYGSVLAVKNGLLAGASATAAVDALAGALPEDAGAELLALFGDWEQAASAIDVAIARKRRRGMKAPQGCGPATGRA